MLKLRPHQAEVVDKLAQGFQDGHRCQLLYAPTGFGKTEVAMAVMVEEAKKLKNVAMVLDRIVLVNQTSTRLGAYLINHGVMQADHWRYRPYEKIQVCSAQTLESRDNFPDVSMLIIDECHVQRKQIIQFIKDRPDMKVIGLTATPFTNGLGDVYTNVVGAKPTGDLIEEKWLTPLKIFIAKEIDMTGADKVAGEWSQDETTKRGMQITGDIVQEWINKTNEVFGGPRKTVVFCSGVEHGRDLVRQFNEAGYNFKSISYKEDDEFKAQTIEDFSRPDTLINGLVATDILTRGFDVSDVMIGVSARPFSKSFSSHVQQMGRVMRPYEGKAFGLWLDHSGNYLRFRKEWDKLFDEGVTELENGSEVAKKEPTDQEKKEAKCPACGALWVWPDRICGECGYEKPTKQILNVPGELTELETTKREALSENQNFYSELLYYAKMRGYKEGWAAHKYKEKYGVYPKGLHTKPQATSSKTANWIKSKNIAWAKAKAKQ
jgi:superfamily II DNA or RNA helicase